MLASKWSRCDLRCISRDPGIPHGCDPRSFRLETERPLGTSASAAKPVDSNSPSPSPVRGTGGQGISMAIDKEVLR